MQNEYQYVTPPGLLVTPGLYGTNAMHVHPQQPQQQQQVQQQPIIPSAHLQPTYLMPQAQVQQHNSLAPKRPNDTQLKQQQQQQKAKENKNFQQEKYYKDKMADFNYLLQSGYKVYRELGRGGYGVVYKASDTREGIKKKYAIKINFQTVSPELIFSEIAFLTLLKGKPNTPQMVDLFTYEEKTHIIIEYFKFQPFIEFFADANMEDIKHYIYQMLLGVRTLRSLGIFHRDVKPGNFLYNKNTKKGILIDYGLSEIDDRHIERLKEENKVKKDPELQKQIDLYQNIKKCEKIVGKNKIGTESFMPLESILRFRDQGYQVDIWPIGVVFLQFLLKKYNIFNNVRMQNKPNQNKNNHNKSGQLKNTYFITFILELANIFGSDAVVELCRKYEYEVTIPKELPRGPINFKDIIKKEGFDDVAEDLLKKLIALDQADRINVYDALAHPFFDSIREYEEREKQAQKLNQPAKMQQVGQQAQQQIPQQQQQQQQQQLQQQQQPLGASATPQHLQTHLQRAPQFAQQTMDPYNHPYQNIGISLQQISMNGPVMFCMDMNAVGQAGFPMNQPQQNYTNYNPKNMMNLQQQK